MGRRSTPTVTIAFTTTMDREILGGVLIGAGVAFAWRLFPLFIAEDGQQATAIGAMLTVGIFTGRWQDM